MIDFDNIDSEILDNPKENEVALIAEQAILNVEIDLAPFIEAAENFEVISKITANQCLSMSLQARKMRQSLDKSRTEILKPYQKFVKEINKQAKDYETKLDEIEKSLSDKILKWLENPEESETLKMNVDDGSLCKKEIWAYEIFDHELLRPSFLKPDEAKIREYMKTYNGIDHLPGMNVYKINTLDLRVKNT